jgi:hypothetical protein
MSQPNRSDLSEVQSVSLAESGAAVPEWTRNFAKPRQEIRMTSGGQPNDCSFAGGPGLLGGRHSGLCRLRLCVGAQSRSADLLARPEPTLSPGVPD